MKKEVKRTDRQSQPEGKISLEELDLSSVTGGFELDGGGTVNTYTCCPEFPGCGGGGVE